MGDLDITLRHVAQAMPAEFARGLLGPNTQLEVDGWQETQVTTLERRLDRVLAVRVGGRRRWLHVEWQWEWAADLPYRVFEYQALLTMAQRDPSHSLPRARIESTIVLLSGRQEPWPLWGHFRLSPNDSRFSGARFRIDPVYQQSTATLLARGSLLWLVFAPLAVDASAANLTDVLTAARDRARNRVELAEVATAMAIVAEYSPAELGLKEVLMGAIDEGMLERSWPFKKGEARGEAKGEAKGRTQGLEMGLEPLRHLVERRLGRPITVTENAALRERLSSVGAARLGDVVLDLTPVDLAAWLLNPDAR